MNENHKKEQILALISELRKSLRENDPQNGVIHSRLNNLEQSITETSFSETNSNIKKEQVGAMNLNSSTLRNWIAIIGLVLGLIIGGVRLVDSLGLAHNSIVELKQSQENEKSERIAEDMRLRELIRITNENSAQQYSEIQIKLREMDTHLVYIRKSLDNL